MAAQELTGWQHAVQSVITVPEGTLPDRAHGRIFVDHADMHEDWIRCLARRLGLSLAAAEERLSAGFVWSQGNPEYVIDGWSFGYRMVLVNADHTLVIDMDTAPSQRISFRDEERVRRFHESG